MQQHPATAAFDRLFKVLDASVKRSRTNRYMARVDERIRDVGRDEALTFLRAELDKWHERYQRFQAKIFAGEDLESDVSAWDYAETIGAVAAKIARLERQTVAA
jgi:hypothetical protein